MDVLKKDCEYFLKTVLPESASKKQAEDMATAFYAGAKCMLMIATIAGQGDEDLGCLVMDSVNAEIDAFFQVWKERAEAERRSHGG